jgi:hypothetical protein
LSGRAKGGPGDGNEFEEAATAEVAAEGRMVYRTETETIVCVLHGCSPSYTTYG